MSCRRPELATALILVIHLLATSLVSATAPALPQPRCHHPQAFQLDGVSVVLCSSFLPTQNVVASEPDQASQVATFLDWRPEFRELSLTAVPYGMRPVTEDLPTAAAGSTEMYRVKLRGYRVEQGGSPLPAPTLSLFGQDVPGSLSIVSLPIRVDAPASVAVAEWVTEYGERVWILRASVELSPGAQDGAAQASLAQLADLTVTAERVEPSTSVAAMRQAAAEAPDEGEAEPDMGPAADLAADLPFPPWWNGDCDLNNYRSWTGGVSSFPLGGSYRGVKACGPRPNWDPGAPNPGPIVRFFAGAWGEYEWQCVELAMRYLYLAFGIRPYGANGSQVVANYTGTRLVKINNGTAGRPPRPGDVMSFGATSSFGHTSIVVESLVDGNGNGTIRTINQNLGGTSTAAKQGYASYTVSGWRVVGDATGWLHDASGEVVNDTTPPTISFTSAPQTGRWYNTNQRVDWSVSDSSGIWGFSQAWNSTPSGPPPQFPGATAGWLDFNSSGEGAHTVRVRAWDSSSNRNQADAQLGWLGFDASLPTGAITSHAENSATSNPAFSIAADAGDAYSGVNRVEYFIHHDNGWHGVCSDSSAPYVCSWNAGALGDQLLTFTIHVVDNAGNRVMDPGGYRHIYFDRTAPTVTFEQLSATQTSATFQILWGGNDNLTGVVSYDVEVSVNGGAWQPWLTGVSRAGAAYTGVDGSQYAFRARARDGAGNASPFAGSGTTLVQVNSPDAYEADNSSGAANTISEGLQGVQQHNFHVVGDEDWVRFWAEPAAPLSLRTSNLNGGVDTMLELYDAALNLVAANDDWGGDRSSRIDFHRPASGWMYARVKYFGNTYGPNSGYTLMLARGDSFEHDNDSASANQLLVESSAGVHSAHVPGDRDLLAFTAVAGKPYTLMTSGLGSSSDTVLEVQSGSGVQTNDDTAGLGLASRIDYVATAGPQLVTLRQWSSNAFGPNTAATLIVARGDDFEHDNSYASAKPLPADGTPRAHTVHVPGDLDWHALELTAGNDYAIKIDLDGEQADVVIALYDSDGTTLLAENTDVRPSIGWRATHSGTHYLRIRPWSNSTYGAAEATGYRVALMVDNETPSVSITSGHPYTQQRDIAVAIDARDNGSGIDRMELALRDPAGNWTFTGWIRPEVTYRYTLPDQNGSYWVAVHVRDYAGHISDWVSVNLTLDREAPVVSLEAPARWQDTNRIELRWSAGDGLSGVDTATLMVSANAGPWEEIVLDGEVDVATYYGEPGVAYRFALNVADRAGNTATSATTSAVLVPSCTPDDSEPDNGPSQAPIAVLNAGFAHSLCGRSDQDWVALQAASGSTYTIATSDLHLSDTVLTVIGPDGTTELVTNDDAAADTLASRIVWQAPRSGRYYIKVHNYNQLLAGSAVSYKLTISADAISYRVMLPLLRRGGAVTAPATAPTAAPRKPTLDPVAPKVPLFQPARVEVPGAMWSPALRMKLPPASDRIIAPLRGPGADRYIPDPAPKE